MKTITKIFTTRKLVLLIFLVGILLRVSLLSKQQDFHIDTFLSLNVASGHLYKQLPEDKWLDDKQFFDSFFTIQNKIANYKLINDSTAKDNHPPLYYYVLHWLMTANGGELEGKHLYFLALIFYAASFLMLFKLSSLILESYPNVLFALFLFSVSLGSLSGFLVLRMYMLQTPLILGAVYLFFSHINKEKLNYKDYLPFGILCFLASYTHYYSLVAIFIISLLIVFHYTVIDQNFERIKKYLFSIASALTIVAVIFPNIIPHLTGSVRGKEVQDALFSNSGSKLSISWGLIQNQIFPGLMLLTLIYIVGFSIYKLATNFRGINNALSDSIKVVYLFWLTLPLSLFLLYISPYNQMRYVYLSTPYIFIWIAYYIPTFSNRRATLAIFVFLVMLSSYSVFTNFSSVQNNLYKNLLGDVSEGNLYIVRETAWKTIPAQFNSKGKRLYLSKNLKLEVVNASDRVAVLIENKIDSFDKLERELVKNSYKRVGAYSYFSIFVKKRSVPRQ